MLVIIIVCIVIIVIRVDREGFAQHSQLPLAPAAEFPTEVQAVVAPSGEV